MPPDMQKHPLFSLFEKGAVDWAIDYEARHPEEESAPLRSEVLVSAAISLKRIADALQPVNIMAEAGYGGHDFPGPSYPPPPLGECIEVEDRDGTHTIMLADKVDWNHVRRWRRVYRHTRVEGHIWFGTSNEALGFVGLGDLIVVRHADGGKIAEWFLGDALDWSKPGRVLKSTFDAWHPK